MGAIRKIAVLRTLKMVVIVGLAVSLLVNPNVRAGHLATSPAEFEEDADPDAVDGVAIRGTNARSSTGPDDVPAGVSGRVTGDASGVDSEVSAIIASASGNATGTNSEVRAITARATGNATARDSQVVAIRAVVTGSSLGPDSAVVGIISNARSASGFAVGVRGQSFSTSGIGIQGVARATSGNTLGVFGGSNSTSGIGVLGRSPSIGVWGQSFTPNGVAVQGSNNAPGGVAGRFQGRVEIFCSTPPCLSVNGGTIADLAENLPLVARVAPGDAVVLAEGQGGYGVVPASRPYDTRVAGVISAHPPIVLQPRQRTQSAPVAMVGIVRAKATGANGAIRFGDLLTTSYVPGHLMRCPTPVRCVGAIVGKALEPLAKGEKQILVMLWRQ